MSFLGNFGFQFSDFGCAVGGWGLVNENSKYIKLWKKLLLLTPRDLQWQLIIDCEGESYLSQFIQLFIVQRVTHLAI